MAEPLTDRQQEVLDLFVAAARYALPAPTYREICDELGLKSTCGAADHIEYIIRKGWLERWEKNSSRSLVLTNHARRIYGLPVLRGAA